MENNNNTRTAMSDAVKILVTALVSASLTFLAVWFTAVEGSDSGYAADRQYILSSLDSQATAISQLQGISSVSTVQLAEIRIQLIQMERQLDRLEAYNMPQ